MEIKTLIVDDQADIRQLLRLIIETEDGGLVVGGEAAGGQEALDQLEELNPDVVVLDHMMPGMTGIETATRIREIRPDIRMLLCSAYIDDDVQAQAETIGIGACLSKADIRDVPKTLIALANA